MNPEWQARVSSKLDEHDKDLHTISESLSGIKDQMERTNSILQDFAIQDERFNSRIDAVETRIMARVEKDEEVIKTCHKRLDKLDAIVGTVAKAILVFVLMGVLASVVKFGV